jgi:hypothetical protein
MEWLVMRLACTGAATALSVAYSLWRASKCQR